LANSFSLDHLVEALQYVIGFKGNNVVLHEPEFKANELKYVQECLETGWVSSAGKFVDEFEAKISSYTGAKYAVAVVNGTSGLHLALIEAGVLPGDEVLCPALTFVATANAVSYCGAVPHFVDSSESTMGLDPAALSDYLSRVAEPFSGGYRNRKTGRRLAAILPMHTFGHPVDISGLLDLAKKYCLEIVEDAAEALGSWIGSRHVGTYGRSGVFSFNGNKIITTGGGGAIITNDLRCAQRLKHLSTTAKKSYGFSFVHDEIGFNYRLPNINAALGCAQMESLPDILSRKRELASRYKKVFSSISSVRFMDEPVGCRSNFWLNTIYHPFISEEERDELLNSVITAGFHCRPVWRLLSRLSIFSHCPRGPLPVAEALEKGLINLPSSPKLTER